jgi:cysteine-rich repeat protein
VGSPPTHTDTHVRAHAHRQLPSRYECSPATSPYSASDICVRPAVAAGVFVPPPPPSPVVCGNGLKEGSEQCDDGNVWCCDGCSAK